MRAKGGKKMIYCADDFGQSTSINAAIVELAQAKKIQAVSVLVNRVSQAEVDLLVASGVQVQIGLHLDLFAAPRWGGEAAIVEQVEKFQNLFKKFPDYIDGHMHCHIYPFWGEALIRTLLKYDLKHDFYLRSVVMHPLLLKECSYARYPYLAWLGFWGYRFKRKLVSVGLKSNRYCWGVYGRHATTAEVYELASKKGSAGDLFFIHPDAEVRGEGGTVSDYDFARALPSSQN